MTEETAFIWTPNAAWRGREYFTGNMRFAVPPGSTTEPPVLQQEWAVKWGNNMGEMLSTEWVDVPRVIVTVERRPNNLARHP